MSEPLSQETINALIQKDISSIQKSIEEINAKLDHVYVTKDEHALVVNDVSYLKKVVYGFVGTVLLAFIGALTYIVFPR